MNFAAMKVDLFVAASCQLLALNGKSLVARWLSGAAGYFCRDGDAAATGKDDPKLHLAMPALCDAEIASALRVRNVIVVPLVSMGWSNEAA
jgi:hypothetical protein